jgi:hypothetical protein
MLPIRNDDLVREVIDRAKSFTKEQLEALQTYFCGDYEPSKRKSTGDMDLHGEILEHMAMAKDIRDKILLANDINPREAKDALQTVTGLISTLTKHEKEVKNMQRVAKIEKATVAAISTLPEESREVFWKALEKELNG